MLALFQQLSNILWSLVFCEIIKNIYPESQVVVHLYLKQIQIFVGRCCYLLCYWNFEQHLTPSYWSWMGSFVFVHIIIVHTAHISVLPQMETNTTSCQAIPVQHLKVAFCWFHQTRVSRWERTTKIPRVSRWDWRLQLSLWSLSVDWICVDYTLCGRSYAFFNDMVCSTYS